MRLSTFFEKKIPLFKKRDREAWLQIRKVLKEEKISGVSAGHYQQEKIIAGGCASQLDPRDWGKNGKIDRDIYYVNVAASQISAAREALRKNGIVAVIESFDSLTADAPDKIKGHPVI